MKTKNILHFLLLFTMFAKAQHKDVFQIARNGTLEEIESLYNSNHEIINTLNDQQYSPLILACYKGNVKVALFLAEKVKDINYNSTSGTALMASVMSGDINILKKLLEHNANVNITDKNQKTALIYACFFNKTEIAKLLLKAETNINHKDNDGKTALDYATFNKNTELIILLTNK
ncbi:ankyrin repeat domain-containing protein [Flavobacterium psychrophilum]|uniref:ankyrin repeat domain-containing protein n=1 Tax=Flavobacterium psychrophilum TaxID=96345 RepID=UPI00090457A3|nr:ankyrin repeat domain-containing protein [Flavobacterium psychrophilum]EKT4501901.1 ankyrin repeat domain-containing protein [Flavobacterium psychrophilum]ELM3643571.1 ankyrin repeat domain-containing protein [Flavobacterium psychrophilum]MCB6098667.1 ankyrin repeat domain-containing protein [Flavobacterium psychrophilum]OJH13791.1 hypothetical protein FPG87_09265 [Flavobacterium psychrophilum]OUD28202.1 hypothetical protein FPG92_04385 [Flavobacterium psychrophilum]